MNVNVCIMANVYNTIWCSKYGQVFVYAQYLIIVVRHDFCIVKMLFKNIATAHQLRYQLPRPRVLKNALTNTFSILKLTFFT